MSILLLHSKYRFLLENPFSQWRCCKVYGGMTWWHSREHAQIVARRFVLTKPCINMKTLRSFHFIFHPRFDRNVFSCFQLTKSGSTLKAPSLTDFGVFVQVFAFVKSDQSNNSTHRADCHVCESLLEFRTEVEVINLLMPKLLFCFLFKELNM
jgi:hypothetical protein